MGFENMTQTEIYFTLYKISFILLLRVEEQIIIFIMLEITIQLSLPEILYFNCIIPDIILLRLLSSKWEKLISIMGNT